MDVHEAIAAAERVVPERQEPEGQPSARWQAVLELQAFAETDPEPLWAFARRWGAHPDADVRTAVATCLLEHLLEHHFALLFPRVEGAAAGDPRFAHCFSECWPLGEAERPENLERFEALKRRVAAI